MEYCSWMYKQGRDSEGEKFVRYDLVHETGRILARIHSPNFPDAYIYDVLFKCHIPPWVLRPCCDDFEFTELDGAKNFVEEILSQFNPFDMTDFDEEIEAEMKKAEEEAKSKGEKGGT